MAKSILVQLFRQKLIALDGGARRYEFHCATGDSSHPTPLGEWRIIRKHRFYRSHKYGSEMNHALFFTGSGEAIHESKFVTATSYAKYFGANYFGSKGCVRLSENNARELFNWANINTKVTVTT